MDLTKNHFIRYRNTYAEISIPSLRHNFRVIRGLLTPDQTICPMVKASAYGHGASECALALEDEKPDAFGVALVEEGIELRLSGVQTPILVFALFDSLSIDAFLKYNLTPVLSSWEQLYKLVRAVDGNTLKIHVKFNTGMNRLGFEPGEASALQEFLSTQRSLKLEAICTHFADSDDFIDPNGMSHKQLAAFQTVQSVFKGIPSHFLNSAGIFRKISRVAGARPGLSLYGLSPSDELQNKDLQPVMAVKSFVGLVHKVKIGETVSYGCTWRATRPSTIGVVPIGYADGYPRLLSNRGRMLFRGQRVPIVGRVCMDYVMCDLTDAVSEGPPQAGEEICIIGRQGSEILSVSELAELTGTISYEILTGIGARIPRIYLH